MANVWQLSSTSSCRLPGEPQGLPNVRSHRWQIQTWWPESSFATSCQTISFDTACMAAWKERRVKEREEVKPEASLPRSSSMYVHVTCRVWHWRVCRYAFKQFVTVDSAWHITFDFLALKSVFTVLARCHSPRKYQCPSPLITMHYARLPISLGKRIRCTSKRRSKERRPTGIATRCYKQFEFHCS